MYALLLVFLLACTSAFADGEARSLTNEEKAALRTWGNRQGEVGALLNPPRGSVAPDVRQTESYLYDLVDFIAGERIMKSGKKLFISISSNPEPDAFVMLHAPVNISGRQFHYNVRDIHGGNTPQFANMLGFDPKENIYELSISVGLLRLCANSKAKLAAVLSHELKHLLEGHPDELAFPDRNGKRKGGWWNSQAFEVVADLGALELIAGRFRLEAFVEVMWELSRKAPNTGGIYSLATTHHHPGVRLSILQARIENIRRKDLAAARVTADEPLPKFTQISVSGSTRRSPEFDALKPAAFSFLDKILPQNIWISRDYIYNKNLVGGSASALHEIPNEVGPSAEQNREFTVEYLERLESLVMTKEQHLHMIFRFLVYQAVNMHGDIFSTLTDADLDRLTFLIGKYSTGASPSSLTNIINRSPAMTSDPAQINVIKSRWLHPLFSSPRIQPKMAHLVAVYPAWRRLAYEYMIARMKERSVVEVFDLVLHGRVYDFKGTVTKIAPRLQIAMQHIVKSIPKLPEETLDHCPENIAVLEQLKENSDPEMYRHLKQLLDDQAQVYQKRRLAQLRGPEGMVRSSGVNTSWAARNPHLAAIRSVAQIPLSDDETRLIRPYVLDLARGNISFDFLAHAQNLASPGFYHLISEMLSEPIADEDKFNLMRMTTLVLRLALEGKSLAQEIPADVARSFATYLKSLDKNKLLSLFNPHFPNLEQEVVNELAQEGLYFGTYDGLADVKSVNKPGQTIGRISKIMEELHKSENSLLVLLSHPALPRTEFADHFSSDFYFRMMNSLVRSSLRKAHAPWTESDWPNVRSIEFLVTLFIQYQSEYKTLETWLEHLNWIRDRNALALEQDDNYKKQLALRLEQLLKETPIEERGKYLSDSLVHRLLPVDSIAKWIVDYLEYRVNRVSSEPHVEFNRVIDDLKIREDQTVIYRRVVTMWSERKNLQPSQFRLYNPEDTRSMTEMVVPYASHIRGLSGMVAEIRRGSPDEQIQAIEYLMGSRSELPAYLRNAQISLAGNTFRTIALSLVMLEARERLARADVLERTIVVNCILAGPNALGGTNRGKLTLLKYFTKDVQEKNQELANVFGKALIRSQGTRASLAYSYIFASKSLAEDNSEITPEARILRSLFTAFGVPGIKLGQYLGFTAEFKEYEEALRSLQDSATPLTYHAAVQLILSRYGDDWPLTHQVLRVIGSGSVNIAVEVLNTATGENEVYSILREDIEASMEEDFRNLNEALKYVIADRKWGSRLRFLAGLSRINQMSIRLELDKERVFLMQQSVYPRYNVVVDKWNVKTVRPYDHGHGGMRMQKAPGSTARKVLERNPELYKSALRALNKVEMDLLLGRTGEGYFLPTHANPDFHDGQVIIDEATKTVTILDFGQAVEITNAERELGMDLLVIISGVQSLEVATQFVNDYLAKHGAQERFTDDEMKAILSSKSRMDIFTKLIAEMELKGKSPPLSTIHWVLAVNRAIELGKKIGANNELEFGALIMARKINMEPAEFNRIRASENNCSNLLQRVMTTSVEKKNVQ